MKNKHGWVIEFTDGTTRQQFENGKEILFEDVFDESTVCKLRVMDWEIDLENCEIKHTHDIYSPEFSIEYKPKLVYKRRNKLHFQEDGTQVDGEISHIMGVNDGEVSYAAEVFEDGTYIEPRICDEEALL